MKYIITESQFDNFVYQYLDSKIDSSKLSNYNPFEYDDEGKEYEDKSRVGVEDEDETLFMWYDKNHWSDNDYVKKYKKNSPVVEINDIYFVNSLNSHFGKNWYDGFKKWFTEKTGLPVNKLTNEIE